MDKLPRMPFDEKMIKELIGDDRYYTPTIEELHLLMEVEVFNSPEFYFAEAPFGWTQVVIGSTDMLSKSLALAFLIHKKRIRVRKLCREDIEELGWVFVKEDFGDVYKHSDHHWLEHGKESVEIRAREEDDMFDRCIVYFSGTIRNKSELRRLMQQIGIFTP